MFKKCRYALAKKLPVGLVATVATLCLLLLTPLSALANTVNISDQAGVLNVSQVRSTAQSLPKRVDVYTVNGYNGGNAAFDQEARNKVPNNDSIVIAINTSPGHVYVTGGRNVSLSSSQYQDAVNAFTSNYKSGGYTGATVAALNSLNSSLNSSLSGPMGAVPGGNIGGGTICCIGLLVLGGIAFFAFSRRRRAGIPPQPTYNAPYNQYGQPNYGGQPNQGMNPWAAGGLGAAGGGLLGYELGRQAGERENQGGNYGGGQAGGGAGGDFGGGGGGGDFGSGGGGGGGAGGDFGGGGGGGDFGSGGGGGGGGNF